MKKIFKEMLILSIMIVGFLQHKCAYSMESEGNNVLNNNYDLGTKKYENIVLSTLKDSYIDFTEFKGIINDFQNLYNRPFKIVDNNIKKEIKDVLEKIAFDLIDHGDYKFIENIIEVNGILDANINLEDVFRRNIKVLSSCLDFDLIKEVIKVNSSYNPQSNIDLKDFLPDFAAGIIHKIKKNKFGVLGITEILKDVKKFGVSDAMNFIDPIEKDKIKIIFEDHAFDSIFSPFINNYNYGYGSYIEIIDAGIFEISKHFDIMNLTNLEERFKQAIKEKIASDHNYYGQYLANHIFKIKKIIGKDDFSL